MERGNRTGYMRAAGLLAALALTLCSQSAMAQFTLDNQDRSLQAFVSIGASDGTTSSGAYNNSVSDQELPDGSGDTVSATGTASQDTDIETSGFSGTGSGVASAEVNGPVADSAAASASSSFDATFTVPVPTVITLTGNLAISGDATGSVSFDTFSSSSSGDFSFSETIEPGLDHTLSLQGDAQVGASIDGSYDDQDDSDTGSGAFTFALTGATVIPEPASAAMVLVAVPGVLNRRRRNRAV
jgi:hypothetical protein